MPAVCSREALFSNFHSLDRKTIEFLPNVLTSELTYLLLLSFAWLFRTIWKGFWFSHVRIVCFYLFDMIKVVYLQRLWL